MIIKIDRGDNIFTLFENIENLIYPKNNFHRCISREETVNEYFNSILGAHSEGPPYRVRKSLLSDGQIVDDDVVLYFGDGDPNKNCIVVITFISNRVSYTLATQYPVYICNDSGKTIEVIK